MSRKPSEDAISTAADDKAIVDLLASGLRAGEIARASNGRLTVQRVREVLRREAQTIRGRATELVAARWTSYDQMLNRLITSLYHDLLFSFDKDKAAAFVKLMDRHARHLGSDMAQKKAVDADEWMGDKDERQIKEWIKTQYHVDLDAAPTHPIPDSDDA